MTVHEVTLPRVARLTFNKASQFFVRCDACSASVASPFQAAGGALHCCSCRECERGLFSEQEITWEFFPSAFCGLSQLTLPQWCADLHRLSPTYSYSLSDMVICVGRNFHILFFETVFSCLFVQGFLQSNTTSIKRDLVVISSDLKCEGKGCLLGLLRVNHTTWTAGFTGKFIKLAKCKRGFSQISKPQKTVWMNEMILNFSELQEKRFSALDKSSLSSSHLENSSGLLLGP